MMRMSSSRSFRFAAILVTVVIAAGVAGAVSVSSQDAPQEAQVGDKVSATFTFTELYTTFDEWTLNGTTELEQVTWTAENIDLSDNVIAERSYDGQSFGHKVSKAEDVAEVRVTISGTVPEVGNYTYEEEERFLFAEFNQNREGGTSAVVETYDAHHFTESSKEARTAIDRAQAAIDAAGGNQQAQRVVDNAISAYRAGNFGNAVDLADQARERVESAQQQSQQFQLLVYAGIGVVVLGIVIGAVYWYRSQQTGRKL